MTIAIVLSQIPAPDERYHVLPTVEMFVDPEVIARISDCLLWYFVFSIVADETGNRRQRVAG